MIYAGRRAAAYNRCNSTRLGVSAIRLGVSAIRLGVSAIRLGVSAIRRSADCNPPWPLVDFRSAVPSGRGLLDRDMRAREWGKSIDDRGRGARRARRAEEACPSASDRGATKPAGIDRPRGRLSCPFTGPWVTTWTGTMGHGPGCFVGVVQVLRGDGPAPWVVQTGGGRVTRTGRRLPQSGTVVAQSDSAATRVVYFPSGAGRGGCGGFTDRAGRAGRDRRCAGGTWWCGRHDGGAASRSYAGSCGLRAGASRSCKEPRFVGH